MAAMVSMIPNDFIDELALYMVRLLAGSDVEMIMVGYNSKATMIRSMATVIDEKTNAYQYFRLVRSLGILAILRKAMRGIMKNTGFSLKRSDRCGK